MDYGSASYSRFQVLTEGRPAWAQDGQGLVFDFDGMRFWRPARRGERRIVASWQSPTYGWEHEPECSCHLCDTRHAQRHQVA